MKKHARYVGCSLCSMWSAVAKLPRCQASTDGLDDPVASTFCGKMTEDVTHCNGADASPFLCKAIKEAPRKVSRTDGGALPSNVRLTKETSARRSSSPSFQVDALTMSFNCCGHRPSRRPANNYWGRSIWLELRPLLKPGCKGYRLLNGWWYAGVGGWSRVFSP